MVVFPVAWHLLIDRAALRAGESVLVMAAGGALGVAGVQIAKRAGAQVIAAAGADWKLEKAKELGAENDFYRRHLSIASAAAAPRHEIEHVYRLAGAAGASGECT
jgi:NADPH:quinone reductase-like Zn-dependent oxidoreductase